MPSEEIGRSPVQGDAAEGEGRDGNDAPGNDRRVRGTPPPATPLQEPVPDPVTAALPPRPDDAPSRGQDAATVNDASTAPVPTVAYEPPQGPVAAGEDGGGRQV